MKVNINVPSVDDFRSAGGQPEYAVTDWPGDWTLQQSDPVGAIVKLIDKAAAVQLLPYMNDYLFGDDITLAAVKGIAPTPKKGRTLIQQRALTKAIADGTALRNVKSLVPIEPEFFKADVMNDGGYAIDKMVSESAEMLKAAGAETILSPGYWGEFEHYPDRFLAKMPKSVAACDYIAIQALRSVPRNTAAKYDATPDVLLAGAKKLFKLTGKKTIIADLCVSSYGGQIQSGHPWAPIGYVNNPTTDAQKVNNAKLLAVCGRAEEERQRRFWARMLELKPDLQKYVAHVFPRGFQDSGMSPTNYHGWSEQFWNVLRKDGSRKPAFEPFMEFAKPSTAPTPVDYKAMYEEAQSIVDTLRLSLASAERQLENSNVLLSEKEKAIAAAIIVLQSA